MGGRGIAWAIVGVCIGARAVTRARRTVRSLRASGEVFGEAHVTDHGLAAPLTALVGLATCLRLSFVFDGNFTVLTHVVFVSACLVLALVDIDTHALPRRHVYGALAIGAPLLVIARIADGEGSLVTACVGMIGLFLLLNVLAVLSRGDLGGGDVTLALLLGLYTGYGALWDPAVALVAGFTAGGVFALALVLSRKGTRRTRFAFGPFLILGALLVVLR